jgi:ribokinase
MSGIFVLGNFIQVACWYLPQLPQPSDTLFAPKMHFEPGGKGLNVAVGMQRMGLGMSTLMGIGSDTAAQGLLDLCEHEGIATQDIHRFEGSSGWGAAWIAENGQYAGAVYLGANLALTAQHVMRAVDKIQSAKLVYGQFETSLPAVVASFRIAAERSIPTILNPSPWQHPPAELRTSTHTILVNEVEAQHLLGLDLAQVVLEKNITLLLRLVQSELSQTWIQWPKLERVVVTLGPLGAAAFERSGPCWFAQAKEIQAVDTVGAGDAFACGYCTALLLGKSLAQALRSGNACGAYMSATVGVLDALPDAHLLRQLLTDALLPEAQQMSIGAV